jgi:DNA-binding transcriptional LysR family regulator
VVAEGGVPVELRWIRTFVVVAEELNFRRTAERLFIAQPAVSQQIAGLERSLGIRLLDRDNRAARLTDAGEAFLAAAGRFSERWRLPNCRRATQPDP